MAPVRDIITPKTGPDGLFVQPDDASAKREVVEFKNRMRFANHFNYADMYTGNTRSYDEQGRYNCGRCNMEDQGGCLLLKIAKIDEEAGSCEDWENECAGDTEMVLHHKTPEAAIYDVAANGKTWGCKVCPYASKAYAPDSRGRTLYCGKGDFRVYPTACCGINGAPTKNGDQPSPRTAADAATRASVGAAMRNMAKR